MIGEDIVLTWSMLHDGGRSTFEATAIAYTGVPEGLQARSHASAAAGRAG